MCWSHVVVFGWLGLGLEKFAVVPDGAVLKVFAVGPSARSVAVTVGGAVDDVACQLVDNDVVGVKGES